MRRSSVVGLDSRGKVLIVDDDAMILDLLSAVLEGEGFAVATARSAAGLASVIGAEAADVVVLDVGLPGLKGDRALRAVREGLCGKRVPIILYSGECEQDLHDLAQKSGADGAVAKTSAPRVLIGEVERAMSTVRRPRALETVEAR